jgi:hypothetical protein
VPEAEILTEQLRAGGDLKSRTELCDSGLPDVEMCEISESPPAFPAVDEAIVRYGVAAVIHQGVSNA